MNIVFKGLKTGAEIWDIIKHPLLNEFDWDKSKQYEFTQYDKVTKEGVICSESKPVPTEKELAEQTKQTEIAELNNWLDLRRNIDHPEKATKQARLLELLG